MKRTFFIYCVGGGIGFAIDGGGLMLFLALGIHVLIARFFSIFIALFVTWIFHRVVTFEYRKKASAKEFGKYLVSNAFGALTNYIVFNLAVYIYPEGSMMLYFTCASAAALAINFVGAKYFVFSK